MGAHLAMLSDSDHTIISDYDVMQQLWHKIENDDPLEGSINLGKELQQKLGLDIALMSPDESKFFKRVYMNPPRPWIPELEIDHFMAVKRV